MNPAAHDATQRAAAAYRHFDKSGSAPQGLLDTAIHKSWNRCKQVGLTATAPQDFSPLPGKLIDDHKDKHRTLVVSARPVVELLYEQIVNTGSMVLLTDPEGLILDAIGDAEFLSRAKRVALQPGVSWSETTKGTNAVGTAIVERAPVVVHGSEHYLAANQFLTCSASPIVGPMGDVVGVLDVSGDQRSYQQHTLALVRMSVQMIENQMFRGAFREALLLRFHSRSEFLGTLCEGLIAFSAEGQVISANRGALFQLCCKLQDLAHESFESLFGLPIATLLDGPSGTLSPLLSLHLRGGIRVYARVGRPHEAPRMSGAFAPATPTASPELRPTAARRGNVALHTDLDLLDSDDPVIHTAVEKLRRVMGHDLPVLLQGETGTGKERFARAIHNSGLRGDRPFVAINCAAVPEGLIESELFGYEEGAFTGAKRRGVPGKIMLAHGGTLFLDEIGDMPLNLQARLLRVLQEREVTPLGSTRSRPVDIAVICATHRRLKDLIAAGMFREDLYYRLNGLVVNLPPLRSRTDRQQLAVRIAREIAGNEQATVLGNQVLTLFGRHPWPGNMRQMFNVLRTALIMASGTPRVEPEHLPDDFFDDLPDTPPETADQPLAMPRNADGTLEEMELHAIHEALQRCNGNVSAACRQLGISRTTLYRKLKPSTI